MQCDVGDLILGQGHAQLMLDARGEGARQIKRTAAFAQLQVDGVQGAARISLDADDRDGGVQNQALLRKRVERALAARELVGHDVGHRAHEVVNLDGVRTLGVAHHGSHLVRPARALRGLRTQHADALVGLLLQREPECPEPLFHPLHVVGDGTARDVERLGEIVELHPSCAREKVVQDVEDSLFGRGGEALLDQAIHAHHALAPPRHIRHVEPVAAVGGELD